MYIPIATPDELNNLRKSEEQVFGQGTEWEGEYTSGLDKKYIQVLNIDLSGITNFEPIGKTGSEFTGTFDGGGYVISNLKIDRGSEYYVGLFGRASGATFKNVGLEDVDVSGTGWYTGGLVGDQKGSSITNSYATGSVTGGRWYTGGLVGYQDNSSVSDSYATGNVNGGDYTGGLVGNQYDSSIENSYATGSVNSDGSQIGGLVGFQGGSSTVSNSYATGKVTGSGDVGGLVGLQSGSKVLNSYATGKVTGSGDDIGGLVAYQTSSTVTSSYYDTERTEQSDTGKGEGKTTAEMKNKDTYVDWDFESIWTIESGQYPTLR